MDQMIADYSAEIQTAVPSEPICLLGWSTGGPLLANSPFITHPGRKVEALFDDRYAYAQRFRGG